MEILDWIMERLGALVVYTGAITTVTYFLFKLFAKNWIEAQFKSKLDNLKHEHDLELQRLKIEIDSLLSGSLRLQEKEFIVLPDIWEKLNEAHGRAQWVVSPLQQYPNVQLMDEAELEEFLEGVDLRNYDKAQIRSSSEKNELYQELIFWKNLGIAKSANRELSIYLAKNGIFLPSNIKSICKDIEDSIWGALTSKEMGHHSKDHKLEVKGWREVETKVTPLFKAVEEHIRARLLSHASIK